MEPIRLFVGCSANGEDAEAQAMLEYTLRKHHPANDIELHWMMLSRDPASPWYSEPKKNAGWNTELWATPFSVFRWAIPHVCNHEGRAIYCDVDKIFMADIAELWSQVIPPGKAVLWKNDKQSCVMLFDCAAMKGRLPKFEDMRRKRGGYSVYRDNVRGAAAIFKNNWNCLDGETYASLADPDIKIIHFTKVETQPHLKWALPRLKAKGQKHWNQWTLNAEQPQPHRRPDVQPLVDSIWQEAQAAGYTAEKYEALAPNFGNYDAVRGGKRAA
jgi:hypothetical protein